MQYQTFMPWGNLQPAPSRSRGSRFGMPGEYGNPSFGVADPCEDLEERAALRWRSTVLRLSDHFTTAAASHPALAPILMEALGNALEQLLLFGRACDLDLLEEWLDIELNSM
ncbi:hypothetical protein EON80_07965 [bacterium]|nr:MAG: hypothetical protein EON80_07965 [bacterium]